MDGESTYLDSLLERLETINPWLPGLIGVAILLVAALLSNMVVRRALVASLHFLASRSSVQIDASLRRNKVFQRISHVLPAMVIARGIAYVPDLPAVVVAVIANVAMAYVVLTVTLAIAAALTAGNEIYETYPVSRDRPLKGIVQVVQILVWLIGLVLIISVLFERNPLLLLSGVGAMTAVLLLVFKDSILGLVASVQLTANDMVRVGDWVEMPAYGADGDVIEVALHTVKIQNWDKTITTIPTYKLIAESFRNWRGMSESGGRRIKRPLHIDQSSVRFLSAEESEKLERFTLLREHFENKRRELAEATESLGAAGSEIVNRRRLTNLGVFRAYVRHYLKAHPQLNPDMTLLVRHLQPGPEGLPVEIYCFTRTIEWLAYEDVQSDIFDHILAILPEFGLRVFQSPTGWDLASLGNKLEA